MKPDVKFIEDIIFKRFEKNLRFTQDSPVYPDVWLEYFNAEDINNDRVDLILTPHRKSSASELFRKLSEKLKATDPKEKGNPWEMASSGDSTVAKLTLTELITIALPMTPWWRNLWKNGKLTHEHYWLSLLVGAILFRQDPELQAKDKDSLKTMSPNIFFEKFGLLEEMEIEEEDQILWAVNRNRPAGITLEKSVGTTKADASRNVFNIDGSGITWAVLDTGIDAQHPAFRKRGADKKFFSEPMGLPVDRFSNHTRVVASYDFTKFRSILSEIYKGQNNVKKRSKKLFHTTGDNADKKVSGEDLTEYIQQIDFNLKKGRLLDWTIIAPLLRIPHNNTEYVAPLHPHGTHVAGIIGAAQYNEDGSPSLIGMCPGIELFDIRVLDQNGKGDEFNILAALQFLRWKNIQKDGQTIHGLNLSFSMVHSVASYACGATPVCEACESIVSDGTVVVAAAGNLGQALFQNPDGDAAQGFRMVNITDPGNAEAVITVGSTHRNRPHSYGVSYFSSKGPTGDGRLKPDLVAPGEKITSSVLDQGTDRMDGTSMAAPHVSGAAALLLAKHNELIGRPKRVKDILCNTATDLGREKYFQGCGMVDVLRAIQSV